MIVPRYPSFFSFLFSPSPALAPLISRRFSYSPCPISHFSVLISQGRSSSRFPTIAVVGPPTRPFKSCNFFEWCNEQTRSLCGRAAFSFPAVVVRAPRRDVTEIGPTNPLPDLRHDNFKNRFFLFPFRQHSSPRPCHESIPQMMTHLVFFFFFSLLHLPFFFHSVTSHAFLLSLCLILLLFFVFLIPRLVA